MIQVDIDFKKKKSTLGVYIMVYVRNFIYLLINLLSVTLLLFYISHTNNFN